MFSSTSESFVLRRERLVVLVSIRTQIEFHVIYTRFQQALTRFHFICVDSVDVVLILLIVTRREILFWKTVHVGLSDDD